MNRFLPLLFVALFSSSCSYLKSARRMIFNEEEPPKQKVVPKAQYDELMRKYEQATKDSKATGTTIENPDAYSNIKDENPPLEKIQMNNSGENSDLVETVDVFKESKSPEEDSNMNSPSGKVVYKAAPNVIALSDKAVSSEQVKNEIILFRKGLSYMNQNNLDGAMRIFQTLENSSIAQVRVRAKYKIGEILQQQKEYDLALQVYEELINHYAFSGMVIPTLKNLILCSEKLNLKDKKAKYQSILVDIFEQG